MRGDERCEVDVGEPVAAHDEEGGVAEELAEGVGAAGRAHELLLEVVPQFDAELAAVAEVGADLVRVVVQIGGDLGDPVPLQEVQEVLHDRPVEDGHHGLGGLTGERVEPRSQTRGHDHGLAGGLVAGATPVGGTAQGSHPPPAQAAARLRE